MIYLSIGDLLANFYIECVNKNIQIDTISYQEAELYGSKVCELLKSRGIKAVMVLSRNSTDYVLRNFNDFFKETDEDNKVIYNTAIDINTWICKFRTHIEFDALKAFMDVDVREAFIL